MLRLHFSASVLPDTPRPSAVAPLPDDLLEAVNRLWTIVRAFTNVAHDVNNALQVIAGNAELLSARELDEATRRRVEAITVESGRAATVLNRLLTFVRDDAVAPRRVDVRLLVESAVAMRAASVNRGRISLKLEQAGTEACLAVVNTHQLLQAILDLLLAAEEMSRGRRQARMTMRCAREGEAIAISVEVVAEEGIEPPADGTGSIVDAATTGSELWVAGHLAALHGGSLAVQPVDSGLRLVLSVPAVPRDVER